MERQQGGVESGGVERLLVVVMVGVGVGGAGAGAGAGGALVAEEDGLGAGKCQAVGGVVGKVEHDTPVGGAGAADLEDVVERREETGRGAVQELGRVGAKRQGQWDGYRS